MAGRNKRLAVPAPFDADLNSFFGGFELLADNALARGELFDNALSSFTECATQPHRRAGRLIYGLRWCRLRGPLSQTMRSYKTYPSFLSARLWHGFERHVLIALPKPIDSLTSAPADASMFRPPTTENGHRSDGWYNPRTTLPAKRKRKKSGAWQRDAKNVTNGVKLIESHRFEIIEGDWLRFLARCAVGLVGHLPDRVMLPPCSGPSRRGLETPESAVWGECRPALTAPPRGGA